MVSFFALPPGLSFYALVVVLLPVLTPAPSFLLMSLPRFLLGAFPIFLMLGYLLSHSRPDLVLWLLLSTGTGVVLTTLFTTWRWVAWKLSAISRGDSEIRPCRSADLLLGGGSL
jgi:hypothetical protein